MANASERTAVFVGTRKGAFILSADEGESWRQIAAHLPEIQSVTVGGLPS